MTQKITPCLWFDDRISEAVPYYLGVFKGSKLVEQSKYPDGRILVAVLEILGHQFQLLNGGPNFTFTEAVSFSIDCEDQAEVDYYWNTLTADGGEESMCGWLKDKYGLSWQIVPRVMKLLSGPDREGAGRAMQAMLKMRKIVVADIQNAYDGK